MDNNVLVLTEEEVKRVLTIDDALQAVEDVLREKAHARVQMPPKTYIFFHKYQGDFRTMPSYIQQLDIAGMKVVNVHPNNPRTFQKPVVMATIILIDPETGAPLAIMAGTTITAMRTGAIGGVATRYLGRKDSEILALIGAGTQARTQLLAISHVLSLKQVRVYDKYPSTLKTFVKDVKERYPIQFVPCNSAEECVKGADVLSTITPVTTPIVQDPWIRPGTHINAIGADAPGKEELDPQILKRAKIIVDDYEQATHSGEINVPLTKGYITTQDIYGELCEIVAGKKVGRTSRDEITIFDSTGLSLQDIATAYVVYKRARETNIGQWITL